MRVKRIDGDTAWVESGGAERRASLLGVEGVTVGDYVYCEAGVAIARLSDEEAHEILDFLTDLDRLMADDDLLIGPSA